MIDIEIYNNNLKTIDIDLYKRKRYELGNMLHSYFEETEGGCIGNVLRAIDLMLEQGKHIYIFYKGDIPTGFVILYINDQYGLAKPVAVCEYCYIVPEYRSSLTVKALAVQLLTYCVDLQMDLVGVVYNDSSNLNNYKYLGGTPTATIINTELEKMEDKLKKYKRSN